MTASHLIGVPIGYPIAFHRVYPNRGRIAPIVSARVGPLVRVDVSCGVSINQSQNVKAVETGAASLGFGATR